MRLPFLVLKYRLERSADPVVVTAGPKNPMAAAAFVKSRIMVPDISRHPSPHGPFVNLDNSRVANDAAAEGMNILFQDTSFRDDLPELPQGIVILYKYKASTTEPPLDRPRARQNHPLRFNTIPKPPLAALVLTERVETGTAQQTAQFPQ